MKLTFLLLIFVSNFIYAQNLTIGTAGMPLRELKARSEQQLSYFNDEFMPSAVVTLDGKHLTLEAIRYDLLKQHVEYLDKNVVYEVQDSISSFTIKDSIGKSHLLEKLQMNGRPYFFEVIASGRTSLLKRHTAKISETEDWYTKKKLQSVIKRSEYYTLKGGKFERFSPSKKNILALLNEDPERLKTFLNNKPLDFKSDYSLKAIFDFYNL